MIGPSRWLTLLLRVSRGGSGNDDTNSSGNSSSNVDLSSVSSATLRSNLFGILSDHPDGHLDTKFRHEFSTLLKEYANRDDRQPKDVLFTIGSSLFGIEVHHPLPPHSSDDETEDSVVIVPFDYMKEFMTDVFCSYGVPPDRASLCADVLIESDRRGIDSHGLGRLKPIYCDRMDQGILQPSMPIDIIKETDTTALLDGNLGIGLYIGPYCMQLAIDKAKKHGVGFVAVRNSTHYGIAGYYVTMATDQGCIGWSGTNARPSIAPTFGVEPMLGTNPLCFGIPTDEEFPFVIDCATSINQRGKIERYGREGIDTPKGVVVDDQGLERTDTDGILRDMVLGKCALNPVGGAGDKTAGYKGYSWATVVELLSTAFQSGPFGEDVCGVDRATGKNKAMPLGHYFMAIDIEALCPLEEFKVNAGNLLRALRASRKSPVGPGRIWTAGEPEHDARLEREAQGGMVVAHVLQQNMMNLREKRPGLQEKYPKFPWEE
jgi:L-2-hydroxycarboxylate dehydrogenase (NAD+)